MTFFDVDRSLSRARLSRERDTLCIVYGFQAAARTGIMWHAEWRKRRSLRTATTGHLTALGLRGAEREKRRTGEAREWKLFPEQPKRPGRTTVPYRILAINDADAVAPSVTSYRATPSNRAAA